MGLEVLEAIFWLSLIKGGGSRGTATHSLSSRRYCSRSWLGIVPWHWLDPCLSDKSRRKAVLAHEAHAGALHVGGVLAVGSPQTGGAVTEDPGSDNLSACRRRPDLQDSWGK